MGMNIDLLFLIIGGSTTKTITYSIWSPGFNHTTEHTSSKTYLYDMMLEINDANRTHFRYCMFTRTFND